MRDNLNTAATVVLAIGMGAIPSQHVLGAPAALPTISGPLTPNPDPTQIETGVFGTLDLTGTVGGLASWQDNSAASDRRSGADLSNAQFFLQSTRGRLQFFLQVGAYSLPSLGTAYLNASKTPRETYGFVPQAFLKFASGDRFSFEVGKLPSLIGVESTFTFENADIERGLLWNQTSSVSDGIQLNYADGPLNVSISWNDGYYSARYNWFTALVSYALNGDAETFMVSGGTNLGHTGYSTFATPLPQNNSAILDIAYTASLGRWAFTPYLQFSRVPPNCGLGFGNGASTAGAALLVSYKQDDRWSVAARAEALATMGDMNLLYGPESGAWSATLTPTYQNGVFFARAEAAYVGSENGRNGFTLGRRLENSSQARLMLETGMLF